MKLNLLLICYNEVGTIESEILAWRDVLEKLPSDFSSEIVVVEDGSNDGTTELLYELDSRAMIKLLHEDKRSGYNNALLRGIEACDGDYIFFSDTGFKNDLNDFWAIFQRRTLADLIIGYKVLRQDQFHRKLLTKGLNRYLRFILRPNFVLHDVDSGFRLFNIGMKNLIIASSFTFKNFAGCEMTLIAFKAKMRIMEVPIKYKGREGASRGIPNTKIVSMTLRLIKDIHSLLRKQ